MRVMQAKLKMKLTDEQGADVGAHLAFPVGRPRDEAPDTEQDLDGGEETRAAPASVSHDIGACRAPRAVGDEDRADEEADDHAALPRMQQDHRAERRHHGGLAKPEHPDPARAAQRADQTEHAVDRQRNGEVDRLHAEFVDQRVDEEEDAQPAPRPPARADTD